MEIDSAILIHMYTQMVRIRQFEEMAKREFAQDKIFGALHVYIGEEAIAVGVCTNLRPDDYITSTHRGHGHLIAKGGDMKRMFAELLGKKTGYCKGKGGSQHIADFAVGNLGACGIVGGGIPIAVGAAFGAKYKGTDQVTACFFGDGASNTGAFHEAVNLASVLKLPVIFVCENNLYAVSVRVNKALNITDIASRSGAYGIPGVVTDGMDIIAVYKATHEALARCRSGQGPTLIECKTYRWSGHYEGDDGKAYRPQEEVDEWKAKDPIPALEKRLVEMKVLSNKKIAAMNLRIDNEIKEALEWAENSPFPSPDELYEDVYI